MRIRRLSGLEEHLRRRRSSVMRSREGTSSKLVLAIVVSDSDVVVSRKKNRTEPESLSPTSDPPTHTLSKLNSPSLALCLATNVR